MEGQRVAGTPSGAKKWGIFTAIFLAVVLGAYFGLCAWVGSQDTIFPNVSIAGVDVSGMTVAQAQQTMEQAMEQQGDSIVVSLSHKGWTEELTAAQLAMDWGQIARTAHAQGRDSFITQGGAYLLHLVGTKGPVSLTRGGAQPALEQLLARADDAVGGRVQQPSYKVVGDGLVVHTGTTGIAIDRASALPFIMDAFDAGVFRKFDQGESGVVALDVALPVVETAPTPLEFTQIYPQLYAAVKSAQMDPTTYEITDHVIGVDFDPVAAQASFDQAGDGETLTIPLTLTQPKETREGLTAKLFSDLLGEATSTVSGSANRKFNVKLSAQACNNIILLPGENFSYNTATGSRSASKGYLPAPVYIGGKSEEEVGGGICQTSSTIYYAVLHTALELVERRNHMYAVGYVPDGMDATVYFGSTDFRFQNSTEYPIKLVTESYDKGGRRYLTVKLYGTNPEGVYAVPERVQLEQTPPTTQYVAKTEIPRGTTSEDKKQNPYTGKKTQTYRYVYAQDGKLIEKQTMGVSNYKMRPRTIYYNPLDGDPTTWVNGVPPTTPTTPDAGGTTTPETGEQGGGATTPPEAGATPPVPPEIPSNPGGENTPPEPPAPTL